MTAPAIPAPAPTAPVAPAVVQAPVTPVAQPVTPAAESTQEGETFADRIARIGRKVTPDAKAFADQPASQETHPASQGSVLDAAIGQAAQSAEAVPAAPVADPTASVDPGAPTAPSMVPSIEINDPDGQMVMRARDPKTGQFSEMDQSRLYEMSLKDPATGEERIYQKSLPDLMRMAKRGVRMQQAEPELAHYRENVPKWQAQHQTLTQQVQTESARAKQYESLAIELLTAPPEVVDQRREAYAQEFTPERENQRLREQLARANNRPAPPPAQPQAPQADPQVQQMTAAFGQRTAPVLQEVETLVGREAAVGQMALFTLPLLVNGQLPPNRLSEVEAYINGPYREWAKSVAAGKTTAAQELEAARVVQQRAQQAANTIGSAARPTGGMASNAPVPQAPARNREELIQRISRGRPQTAMTG